MIHELYMYMSILFYNCRVCILLLWPKDTFWERRQFWKLLCVLSVLPRVVKWTTCYFVFQLSCIYKPIQIRSFNKYLFHHGFYIRVAISLSDFLNIPDLKFCPSARLQFQVGLEVSAPVEVWHGALWC